MSDRYPVVAGRFYTNDAVRLRREVTDCLGAVQEGIAPLMVMLPHAGYIFCASIIGQTLRELSLPRSVFLLGPNHSGRGKPLAVWPDGKWFTPLGTVEVDTELAAHCLDMAAGFEVDPDAHAAEHALEVLLPFLQCHTPGIRVVPVSVAMNRLDGLRAAGEGIARCIREERAAGREVALVVSSDMNHFESQERTVQQDTKALERLLDLAPEGLFHTVHAERISMCGVCPTTLALFAAKELGAREARLAAYGTSAAVSGDAARVVGYAGVYVR